MKIGKFVLTEELANTKPRIDAVAEYIQANVTVLEKIVTLDKQAKQIVWIIALCNNFEECDDTTKKIPEYTFDFIESAMLRDGAKLLCQVRKI